MSMGPENGENIGSIHRVDTKTCGKTLLNMETTFANVLKSTPEDRPLEPCLRIDAVPKQLHNIFLTCGVVGPRDLIPKVRNGADFKLDFP